MAHVEKRYTLHQATLNAAVVQGINGIDIGSGIQEAVLGHGGSIAPIFAGVLEVNPSVTFRTNDVAAIITAMGLDGAAMTALVMYWEQMQDKGARLSGSYNLKGTASTGYMHLPGISASHGQIVEVTPEIMFTTADGITAPLVWTDSQALASAEASFAHYTMGPVVVTLDGESAQTVYAQSWDYSANIEIEVWKSDGAAYPWGCSVVSYKPTLSVTTKDLSNIISLTVAPPEKCAVDFYLRKMTDHGGGRIANATAEHIKCSIAEAMPFTSEQSGSQDASSDATIMFHAIDDGTNGVVEFDMASAIPVGL